MFVHPISSFCCIHTILSTSCIVHFLRIPFFHMFTQPLPIRYHQLFSSYQIDNHDHENHGGPPEPWTSSVFSSKCMENCKKSSLSSFSSTSSSSSSSSLLVKFKGQSKNEYTPLSHKQPGHTNFKDVISMSNYVTNSSATNSETKKLQFIDSATSTEPSSVSLLFEQTAHNSIDRVRSNHVIIAHFFIIRWL